MTVGTVLTVTKDDSENRPHCHPKGKKMTARTPMPQVAQTEG